MESYYFMEQHIQEKQANMYREVHGLPKVGKLRPKRLTTIAHVAAAIISILSFYL